MTDQFPDATKMAPAPPSRAALAAEPVGEVAELVDRLGWIAAQLGDIGWSDDSASVARAAALLQQPPAPAPAVVPVAVAERPWERGGWCDEQGRCWHGAPDRPGAIACWDLDFEAATDDTHSLPHHAIPLPQGEEV